MIELKKVEIKARVVKEKARSRGHEKNLVDASKKWAKTYGVRKLYLACNIIRYRTHAFYTREGFSKVITSHFFEIEI